MKYKQSFLVGTMLLFAAACFGQLEKTIHQTFDLEGKTTIQLDLFGQYNIVPWAGNNVLVETKIQLYNSSAPVLSHFVEKDKRYHIEADTASAGTIILVSHDKKRAALRTKTGAESIEVVETKVFVPDTFIVRDERTLVMEEEKQ
jgi:hypothetical protein